MDALIKLIAFFSGKKTYVAALGIALLGVVDIINGDVQTGVQRLVEAFGLSGLRSGVAKAEAAATSEG